MPCAVGGKATQPRRATIQTSQFHFVHHKLDAYREALRITAEQAAALVTGMGRVLDQVRQAPPSPIQALEQAVRLEQRLAKFHLTSLAEFAQPTTRKLFEAMLAADQEHVAALERRLEVERKRSVEPPPE